MKFNDNTLAVLKNFAGINPGIVLKPGNVLHTVNQSSSILSYAKNLDNFPVEFGIYDISTFLNNISNLGGNKAELTFDDKKVKIRSEDGFELDYYGSNPHLIKKLKDEPVKYSEFDSNLTVELKWSILDKVLKLAALNGFDTISIIGNEKGVHLKVFKDLTGNATSNSAEYKIVDGPVENFTVNLSIDSLILLPLDYTLKINPDIFVKFVSADGNVYYVIAVKKDPAK